MNKSTRIDWIDIAKGYGIILVIWGHIAIGTEPIGLWISSFHMPLFFFLSGYVFKTYDSDKDFIVKKIRTNIGLYFLMAIPILLFTILMAVLQKTFDPSEITQMIIRILIQDRYLVLWYLACLFWLNLILYLLIKITNNSSRTIAVIIICLAIIGCVYYKCGGGPLPWDIDASVTSLPFFYLGYYFKTHSIINKLNSNYTSSLSILAFGISINLLFTYLSFLITGEVMNINDCSYGFVPFSYIAAVAGILGMVSLSHLLKPSGIRFIGINSLYFFSWHNDIMNHIVNRVFKAFGVTYDNGWPFWGRVVYWMINIFFIILGLSVCAVFINKIIKIRKEIRINE